MVFPTLRLQPLAMPIVVGTALILSACQIDLSDGTPVRSLQHAREECRPDVFGALAANHLAEQDVARITFTAQRPFGGFARRVGLDPHELIGVNARVFLNQCPEDETLFVRMRNNCTVRQVTTTGSCPASVINRRAELIAQGVNPFAPVDGETSAGTEFDNGIVVPGR